MKCLKRIGGDQFLKLCLNGRNDRRNPPPPPRLPPIHSQFGLYVM